MGDYSLDVIDSSLGICSILIFCCVSHQPLLVIKGHVRRCYPVPLIIDQNLYFSILHYTDAAIAQLATVHAAEPKGMRDVRIGCPQVDTNDLTNIFLERDLVILLCVGLIYQCQRGDENK